jgi:hypothetical protein
MLLGDGLERYPSGFKSVSARIKFLVRIVGEGFRPSLCLVLGTTIPSFMLMVVNVAPSLTLQDR